MADRPNVTVVGDLVVDVVVRVPADIRTGSDNAAQVHVRDGGGAGHVAAWLGRAGAHVRFVGRVGDDDAGAGLVQRLSRDAEVSVTRDRQRPTGTVVVLVQPGGERTMLTDRGANRALAAADLPDGAFFAGGHLHLSGYVLLDGASRPAGLAALARARAAGMTTSLSAGTAVPLRAAVEPFVAAAVTADLLFVNAEEAAVLLGRPRAGTSDPRDLAATLASQRPGVGVVMTVGAAGGVYADVRETVHLPAPPVEVVDTTGAGDACCAGFLAAWLAGCAPAVALARGVEWAAEAVRYTGGRPPS